MGHKETDAIGGVVGYDRSARAGGAGSTSAAERKRQVKLGDGVNLRHFLRAKTSRVCYSVTSRLSVRLEQVRAVSDSDDEDSHALTSTPTRDRFTVFAPNTKNREPSTLKLFKLDSHRLFLRFYSQW